MAYGYGYTRLTNAVIRGPAADAEPYRRSSKDASSRCARDAPCVTMKLWRFPPLINFHSKSTRKNRYSGARQDGVRLRSRALLREHRRENGISPVNISAAPEDYSVGAGGLAEAETQGEIVALVHSHPGGQPHSSLRGPQAAGSKRPAVVVGMRRQWYINSTHTPPDGILKHGALTVTSLFRDALPFGGIDMPDFHRDDDWWRHGDNLYLDNLRRFALPCQRSQCAARRSC